MVANYFWDIALAESMLPALHGVELALRNSLHNELAKRFESSMWFYRPGILEPGQLNQLANALGQIARRKTRPTPGHIVAELNFGFWVTIMSGPYEQRLWQPGNFSLMASVFPHARGKSIRAIHKRYNDIRRDLRNRVFHHEAIWNRPNLLQEHADILEAIGWISPTLLEGVRAIDRFDAVYHNRSALHANLLYRLSQGRG